MEHPEVVAGLFPQELQVYLAVLGTHLSGMLFLKDSSQPCSLLVDRRDGPTVILILSHTLAFPCIFQCSLSLEIIKIHPDTILSSVAPLPVCSEGQHQSLALAGNEWTKLEEHLHFDPS